MAKLRPRPLPMEFWPDEPNPKSPSARVFVSALANSKVYVAYGSIDPEVKIPECIAIRADYNKWAAAGRFSFSENRQENIRQAWNFSPTGRGCLQALLHRARAAAAVICRSDPADPSAAGGGDGQIAVPPRDALIESDADPLVVAPDRVAAADELIGFDHEHKRWRTSTELAKSRAAPSAERLRTVQASPLPSKAIEAPFSTLNCGVLRFSIMSQIRKIGLGCQGKLARWNYRQLN